MVAIGRALMTQPRLLLLDEPSLGLSPRLSGELFAVLARIAHDVSVLMVEQNARRALATANRAYLLALGRFFQILAALDVVGQRAVSEAEAPDGSRFVHDADDPAGAQPPQADPPGDDRHDLARFDVERHITR